MKKTIFRKDGSFAFRVEQISFGRYLLLVDEDQVLFDQFITHLRYNYKVNQLQSPPGSLSRILLELATGLYTQQQQTLIHDISYFFCLSLPKMQGKYLNTLLFK